MVGFKSVLLSSPSRELWAAPLIAAINVAVNRAGSRLESFAAGVGGAALMVSLAGAAGATPADQGLDLSAARKSFLIGLVIGIPVAGLTALGAYLPWTQRFFRDQRITAVSPSEAAYELFVRIPLVTATGEELVFRSALEAILSRRRSPGRAALLSAAAFGAWHILPTLDRLERNPRVGDVEGSLAKRAGIVASVCAATSLAGLAFTWLRRQTNSVIAPIMVHYAINAGGFLGAWTRSSQDLASHHSRL